MAMAESAVAGGVVLVHVKTARYLGRMALGRGADAGEMIEVNRVQCLVIMTRGGGAVARGIKST